MRFGRKARQAVEESDAEGTPVAEENAGPDSGSDSAPSVPRPRDSDEVELEEGAYADLGSLWILPLEQRELRLQVDEASGQVASAIIAGPDGALEVRAFAAPRNGDLWEEVRPQIAEELVRAGGEVTEREGSHGTELLSRVDVKLPDGGVGEQRSRMIGINGPRWFLRATFIGAPAVTEETPEAWLATLEAVVVHRGTGAMPPGEALPLVLPSGARKMS